MNSISNNLSFSGKFVAPKGSLASVVKGDKKAHDALKDIVNHVRENTPPKEVIYCDKFYGEDKSLDFSRGSNGMHFVLNNTFLREQGSNPVKEAIDNFIKNRF